MVYVFPVTGTEDAAETKVAVIANRERR